MSVHLMQMNYLNLQFLVLTRYIHMTRKSGLHIEFLQRHLTPRSLDFTDILLKTITCIYIRHSITFYTFVALIGAERRWKKIRPGTLYRPKNRAGIETYDEGIKDKLSYTKDSSPLKL